MKKPNPYQFCRHGLDKDTFLTRDLLGVNGQDLGVYFLLRDLEQRYPFKHTEKGSALIRDTEATWARQGVYWVPDSTP